MGGFSFSWNLFEGVNPHILINLTFLTFRFFLGSPRIVLFSKEPSIYVFHSSAKGNILRVGWPLVIPRLQTLKDSLLSCGKNNAFAALFLPILALHPFGVVHLCNQLLGTLWDPSSKMGCVSPIAPL